MTVAEGSVVYEEGSPPCSGVGIKWSGAEFNEAMDGPVIAVLFDDGGRTDMVEYLNSLAETEFSQDNISRVLNTSGTMEDWRVGEAIAETYLTDHRNCLFPWPISRDERKSGSSLPGADLVGICSDSKGDCLTFGEVKTSTDVNSPPGVMSGLKQQLKDLRDYVHIRNSLFRYLGFRAKGQSWSGRFKIAAKRYLEDSSSVQLYGFLVRDVDPNRKDLKGCVSALSSNCPDATNIELLALYIPRHRIKNIGKRVGGTHGRRV